MQSGTTDGMAFNPALGMPGKAPAWFHAVAFLFAAFLVLDPAADALAGDADPRGIDPDAAVSCVASFSPSTVTIKETELETVTCNVTCTPSGERHAANATLVGLQVKVAVADSEIAAVEENDAFNWTLVTSPTAFTFAFAVRGRSFGRSTVDVSVAPIFAGDDVIGRARLADRQPVAVIKRNSAVNAAYLVILGVMIVLYNIGFGCKINWDQVVAILKKPVAPAIGFCCQFLVMAPLSFGVARALEMSDEAGLGLLSIGAAPGGGGSNVFSYLLDGDLELSITMSFISTVASLGMTPFWIWALGRFFTEDTPQIQIPVTSVFASLAVVTVPVVVGLLIRRFKPETAEKIAWCLRPFTGIIGAVFIGMGVYVYYPALVKVTDKTLLACTIVPAAGYLIGGVSGKIFRQNRPRWLTIALETGFQNLALSLMILGTSLEQPESDLAGVVPICYTFLSASMPALVFVVKFFYSVHKGDKPWKDGETFDLDIGERRARDELPLDGAAVTCTACSEGKLPLASVKTTGVAGDERPLDGAKVACSACPGASQNGVQADENITNGIPACNGITNDANDAVSTVNS